MMIHRRSIVPPVELRGAAGSDTREIRIGSLRLEERAAGEAREPMLVGYAAVFNTATDIGGFFREQIAPGAFGDAIPKSDIHALFNHDDNVVLGRAKAGTLRLLEDDHGLKVEIDPPDTQDVRDLLVKMKRGDIDQMSFAWSMRGGIEKWDDTVDPPLRTIEKVGELYDVSVVTRGAYPTTEVAVRSLESKRDADRRRHNFFAANLRRRLTKALDLRQRKA